MGDVRGEEAKRSSKGSEASGRKIAKGKRILEVGKGAVEEERMFSCMGLGEHANERVEWMSTDSLDAERKYPRPSVKLVPCA